MNNSRENTFYSFYIRNTKKKTHVEQNPESWQEWSFGAMQTTKWERRQGKYCKRMQEENSSQTWTATQTAARPKDHVYHIHGQILDIFNRMKYCWPLSLPLSLSFSATRHIFYPFYLSYMWYFRFRIIRSRTGPIVHVCVPFCVLGRALLIWNSNT